jgi:16S rRNA (cytosine967-C5)-methyltransferase
MTPAAHIAAIIELIDLFHQDERGADRILHFYTKDRRYIGSHDRKNISDLFYTYLRHMVRVDWLMNKYAKGRETARLYFLAFDYLTGGQYAALFGADKYGAAPIQPHEQVTINQFKDTDMPDFIRHECPKSVWSLFREGYGERALAVVESLTHPAPFDVRVNNLKTTRDTVLEELTKLGHNVTPIADTESGIRSPVTFAVGNLAIFRDGWLEPQDASSQIAVSLLQAKLGMRILDLCAGAGGKSLALAAAMGNKGQLYVTDIDGSRLERARVRFKRAGVHNVTAKVLDDVFVKRQKGTFDLVLVDAPCSGSGTWRRNIESRRYHDLSELLITQSMLLEKAAKLVKKGGRLAYSTCSLYECENEQQLNQFAINHPEFKVTPMQDEWLKVMGTVAPMGIEQNLKLNPLDHQTDGFFMGVFARD